MRKDKIYNQAGLYILQLLVTYLYFADSIETNLRLSHQSQSKLKIFTVIFWR